MDKYCFVDVETTGFNPKSDCIIELAFIICNDTGKELMQYSSVTRHKEPVTLIPAVSKLTGLTDEEVNSGNLIANVLDDFLQYTSGVKAYVAHNAQFDERFISMELGKLSTEYMQGWVPNEHPWMCTQVMARDKGIKEGGLLKVANKLDVATGDEEAAHRALYDARICKEIFFKLR